MRSYYTSTIHLSCNNEAHSMLLAWLSPQPFFKDVNSSLVTVDMKKACAPTSHGPNKKPLQYAPWNGEFWFLYKGHWIVFRRVEKSNNDVFARETEEVSLQCFGWSTGILKALLEESREKYLKDLRGKTLIFEARGARWEESKTRSNRDVSTVLHDVKVKEAVLSDMETFLDSSTREWYTERGLPYRRGYLLHGPPGTGKSSFSFSIAGHFGLDIYILSLANLDDAALTILLDKLPQNCVILLEDIDAATSNRAQNKDEDSDSVSGDSEKKQGKKVTLSGLLNALDGVGSQEGRLLIMTTNYVERLDDALIRPGRVDVKVKFRLADRDLIGQLFRLVFKGSDDITTVERLADEFADQVPESEFSPAEVLSLLLEHRMRPDDAVAGVEAWVDKIREERRGLRREGSWLHYG
ncbi:mitochondrial chaperone BCS1 [Verticillium dahliae VdLs.17]|uniref:Mitochondrial chaperone BCS1 n=1 Tax=Verticillium dahliae (strain VdLs.17 / ATCC MYA-4575 / FGSC 10137) TaxID=498257 RepID=G2WXU3_VERDV|nr:mitochondrial chaperone BCS1 [Verticillium dahliae VdLs.17]EGY20901.1 mitochondrial chaperone BCS1 [Verticillium dahliae VdLs.17]